MANQNLRTKVMSAFAGLSMLGISGCASTQEYNNGTYTRPSINSVEHYYDSFGEYKLIRKNNDIYTEKINGEETRQITHTPNVIENYAAFVANGKYVAYSTEGRFFIASLDSGDNKREEIDVLQYIDIVAKAKER